MRKDSDPSKKDEAPRSQVVRCTAQIPYTEDWQDVFNARLTGMGVTEEADKCRVLVTDCMGVEVKAFGEGGKHLGFDQFPLRLHCCSARTTPVSRQGSDHSATLGLAAGAAEPCSPQILYEDVWPGVLWAKLHSIDASVLEDDERQVLVVTDVMGVQLALDAYKGRFPSRECFPLRVHVAAGAAACATGAQSGAATKGRPIEIEYAELLPLAVAVKATLLGFDLELAGEHGPSEAVVLLTDTTGVDVRLDGDLPERKAFPLKLHVHGGETCRLPSVKSGTNWGAGLPTKEVSRAMVAAVSRFTSMCGDLAVGFPMGNRAPAA